MIQRIKINMVLVAAMGLLLVHCSSDIKKADIPSTANPQEEISRLDQDLHTAVSKNLDVLAPADYKKAHDEKDQAVRDLGSSAKQETVLNDLRVGRGYLERAYTTAGDRASQAPTLFAERQAALNAGASNRPELSKELAKTDDEVRDKSDHLSQLTPDQIEKLQNQYTDLERRATVLTQLGNSQAMINGAKKDNAVKLAPQTLKTAEVSMKNAQTQILINLRNPEGYTASVAQANKDATRLSRVMSTIKQNGGKLAEASAVEIVAQNEKINELQGNLTANAEQNADNEAKLREQNQDIANQLDNKDKQLDAAQASVAMQTMIENARTELAKEDAEAYQQGGNLLIRLKKFNFAKGRSDLPARSMRVLSKVAAVAKEMNVGEIKVEGHTDSSGGQAINQKISEDRANAVATYLKSNGFASIPVEAQGYGFEKPIATNKSKEGRAENRRVDIILTPKSVQ